VDQADGSAQFTGDVLVIQGEMRLSADTLRVEYKSDKSGIERLIANGNVLLVNANDAAKSDSAIYTIDLGEVVMEGGVVLSQGQATLTSQRMVIDLKTGMGRMEGGVSTTFTPKAN
jgi:lipopolysaccharide export system protein LptA